MIKQNHILKFEKLSQFDNLVHGFSTNFFGSLRPSTEGYAQSLKKFTEALRIDSQNLVKMDQVHGNTVYFASEKDRGRAIVKTDGLLTDEKDVFLSVITADCVPLLFYDPKHQQVAAVHAGWRGLYSEIIKVAVSEMIKKGSDPKDIVVGIGPCIRACHYNINKELAHQFLAKFSDWKPFIIERDEKLFLDLPAVATHQLQSLSIPAANIEDGDYCTFDHEDVYSCRREGDGFGEMMGIIGIQDKYAV